MSIIEIMVSDCTEVDIVASDIVNANGVTMLAKGTVITNYIKNRLMEIGIRSINVYNSINNLRNNLNNFANNMSYESCKRQYGETMLLVRGIANDLICGKQLRYDRVINVANKMIQFANEKENVLNYLNKVRDTDGYTYGHCINVAFYSMLIATWLGLPNKNINEIIQAALLHDIGKTKISNEILNKKGKLTEEEFNIIKKHTVLGYEILDEIEDVSPEVKNAVLLHHERTDGSGYPYGLTIDSIGLYAKIVAVADVFDAMTSDRVYKSKKTPFDAFEMFNTIGIRMFDTKVLNTFMRNISPYYIGADVVLNNGEEGKIVYIPPQDVLSPIVKVQSDYLDLSKQNNMRITGMGQKIIC